MFGAAKAQPTRAPTDKTGKWDGLPFYEGQWVKYTTDINVSLFPKDAVVKLIDVAHSNPTPTKRAGQVNGWKKTDFDTAYRTSMLVQENVVKLYPCEDMQGSILHRHLATTPGGKPSEAVYESGDIVYLLPRNKTNNDYFVRYPPGTTGVALPIPDGACGMIKCKTTRKAGVSKVRALSHVQQGESIQRNPYVVYFAVSTLRSSWMVCNDALNRAYIKDTTDAEKQVWDKKAQLERSPPPPRVVKSKAEDISRYTVYA